MKVKNLTAKTQQLSVLEIVGGREYCIYVEGKGIADLCGCYVPDMNKYSGVFELIKEVNTLSPAVESHEVETPDDTKDTNEDEVKTPDETDPQDESVETPTPKEPEVIDSKFICSVCGQEFASARGLNSHMSRAHSNE